MPTLQPPQPPSAVPSRARTHLDAYVLSAVLFYCAVFSVTSPPLYILSTLSFLVLLLNGIYLNTPFHIPSLLLSLLPVLLPVFRLRADNTIRLTIRWLPRAPYIIVEFILSCVIFANFVRYAIYVPFFKNVRERRREVVPIAAQSVEPTEEIRQEWQEAARSFADNQQIDDAPNSCGTSSNVQDTPPSSTPDDSPMQPSTSDEISPAEGSRDVPVTATVEHVEQAAKTVLQPSSRSPKRKPRRPRALTKSQIVAAQIMRQRDKDAAAQREKEQHERNEVRMAEQQARMERQARQRERERLQEAVREAMRGVAHAKEELKKKTIEADQARKERRRAADQLKIVPGEENEKVLDDACKDSAKVEMEEQRALDDVNAAQARLIDLRGQLNAFQMR